jgi:long-chain acyl-CoA synthetase
MHHKLCPQIKKPEGTLRTLALYAKNREEWVVTDLGCLLTNITVVTLYDTLGKESIEYILNQADIKTIVMQSDKISGIIGLKKEGKLRTLTHIIYFDELNLEVQADAVKAGLTLTSFTDVLNEGANLSA